MLRKALLSGIFVALAAAIPLSAASAEISGLWDATVVVNKAEIPFRFEIAQDGSHVRGFFFDGDQKIGSTSGSFQNGVLTLGYDFMNTTLIATLSGGQLHGTYRNNRPNSKPMEFQARRFTPVQVGAAAPPQVAGSWEMFRTAPDNSKLPVSWRLYLRQSGSAVSGAILKTSGDTGTLTGRWQDGKLVMSHFSGARPLLFEAKLNTDGTLGITLDRQFTYRAARTSEARADGIPVPPDPSRFTSVKDPTEPFHFVGSNLEGRVVSDKDPRFQGKVVILSIGGSWCPNCRDEAPFLVDLYKEFHSRGLEVVGLFFEEEPDLAAARPQLSAFIRHYSVPFPMLVSGTPDQVARKLPQLVNFAVFPTTIFLGRDGRVRSVHAGFASVATGAEHVRLEREERDLVKQLLGEKPQTENAAD